MDQSLSYACWALLADHYQDTRFKYNRYEARKFAASKLNNGSYELRPDGKNNLRPLIEGFGKVAELCEKTIRRKGAWVRGVTETPGFVGKSNLSKFPFSHKRIVCDLEKSGVERVISYLKEIGPLFSKPDVCEIRNKIQHNREFPTTNELADVCYHLERIKNEFEEIGLAPISFSKMKTEVDSYGRQKITYQALNGAVKTIHYAPEYSMNHMPVRDQTLIFFGTLKTNKGSEDLRYRLIEDSEYVGLWRGFPAFH